MLSIILDSLLLREVWREGFIENHITDILLIGQYGFDGIIQVIWSIDIAIIAIIFIMLESNDFFITTP